MWCSVDKIINIFRDFSLSSFDFSSSLLNCRLFLTSQSSHPIVYGTKIWTFACVVSFAHFLFFHFSSFARPLFVFSIYDLSSSLSQKLMDFIYQLVGRGDLGHAKELREKCYSKMRDREREIAALSNAEAANSLRTHNIKMRSATLLDFKSEHIAEQMTFLDARFFHKIEVCSSFLFCVENYFLN